MLRMSGLSAWTSCRCCAMKSYQQCRRRVFEIPDIVLAFSCAMAAHVSDVDGGRSWVARTTSTTRMTS
jgi:hypothetical protein